MTISRQEFGDRYRRLLHGKFRQSQDQAVIDDEYASYLAITALVGVDGDLDVTLDPSGEIRVLVTPRFPDCHVDEDHRKA